MHKRRLAGDNRPFSQPSFMPDLAEINQYLKEQAVTYSWGIADRCDVNTTGAIKSWIRVCVQLLLFIVFGGQALEFDGNPVTDDILKLGVLRQNIPKDYKIPVHYIPREEGGMCWVKLNVFYLEESLKGLSHKFGNISSNRKDISIIIEMLQGSRIKMGPLDPIMFDFQCHYREERWATARYFDFVKDFLTAAQLKEFLDDCEPPPCPTTQLSTTTAMQLESRGATESVSEACPPQRNCQPQKRILSEVLERSLLSLLFIPLLAIIFLLVWKLRSRRNAEDLEQTRAEEEHFTGAEASAPPLDADVSETNQLNVVTV